MKYQKFVFILSLLMAIGHWSAVGADSAPRTYPQASVSIRVVGEDGVPIKGAEVLLAFRRIVDVRGLTNKDGIFESTNASNNAVGVSVRKEGYYFSEMGSFAFKDVKDGKWQPWNPTIEVVLKPIGKPIPLYAKALDDVLIPKFGSPVGFDFLVGDWVAPSGKGKVSDLFFQLDRDSSDLSGPFNSSLTVTFPDADGGIQPHTAPAKWGSRLRLPRVAPEAGYKQVLVKRHTQKVGQPLLTDYRADNNWFIRTRTIRKDGKIVQAHFGKISGDIEFYPNGKMKFIYYFNPKPNDRNLEFDSKRNLFGEAVDVDATPFTYPQASVSIRVVGEDGVPIEGAQVSLAFRRVIDARGLTNKDGVFDATNPCDTAVGGRVEKDGYYVSEIGSFVFMDVKDDKWQPWNPTIDVVLKAIGKPIPLYAKAFEALPVPEIGSPVGFDFLVGDWVAPSGKGKVSDLFFQLDRDATDPSGPFNSSLTVTFPDADGGIQPHTAPAKWGSLLRLPRIAPEAGYKHVLVIRQSQKAGQPLLTDVRADNNWFIRTRTIRENGKIVQAHFGKISGDIEFYLSGKMRFIYYFNPTPNDRNLEFDSKRNLFGELPLFNRVGLP